MTDADRILTALVYPERATIGEIAKGDYIALDAQLGVERVLRVDRYILGLTGIECAHMQVIGKDAAPGMGRFVVRGIHEPVIRWTVSLPEETIPLAEELDQIAGGT